MMQTMASNYINWLTWLRLMSINGIIDAFKLTYVINPLYYQGETVKPALENTDYKSSMLREPKDDILATVTHELRTPLTSIRAISGILHENPDIDVNRRDQFLDIILQESERLTCLVEEMLDLAELELGKAEWHLSKVNLAEVVHAAVADVENILNEQNICLQLRLPAHLPSVKTDQERIKQVILCLLSNAIKFCDDSSGWIGVRLYLRNDSLQVDVSDNGSGIQASARHKITNNESGRNLDNTFGEEPQTTSLSLLVSRNIVAHFGGKLWFDRDLKHGAKFSFTLPLQAT